VLHCVEWIGPALGLGATGLDNLGLFATKKRLELGEMIVEIKDLRDFLGQRDRPGRFQSVSRRLAFGFGFKTTRAFPRWSDAFGETPKAADGDVRAPHA
jgi:hypothetical protein